MSDPNASEQAINGPKCIEIPRGWSRILENGSILYISPNNSRLRSLDHVVEYLKTEGTCKCGLDCPFFIHKVFNFDAGIPSKLIPVNGRQEPSQSGCKHCVIDYLDVQQPSEIGVKQANDVKLPPFSTLAQKRGPGRPRNPLAKSRKVGIRKPDLDRPTSPLHNIPLPVPSSIINSPVQSVPTNIAVEQGPLPSFATIVSSSKLFNPGAGLGSTLLSGSTVTSAVTSSPITATSLQSSKTTIATSNVAVTTSATFTSPALTGQVVTEASKTTASVTSTVVVSHQQTAVVPASLPSRNPQADTLGKCSSTTVFSTSSTSLTTSAPSRNDPTKETIVSSSTTSVVSTSITATPVAKQDMKTVAKVSKFPDVKVSAKVAGPRTSKSTKSYGARKTVAATLKATAAAKVSTAVTSEATRAGIDSPLQRTQVATTATTVVSSEKATVASSASKPPSQVVPMQFVTTTVQAPALFHSVLKDAIIKEQPGHAVSSPSTIAATVPGTSTVHAAPSHSSRGAQPVSNAPARSKSSVTKEITQATTALVQSVKAGHATPTVPQHVPAHRPQPPVKAGSGQASAASSTSQQQNVQAATVAQSPTQIPSSASSYGQVKNTAGSSQVPSLQIAASQAQGGVFFQGNGNQVFQMNVDSSQLKGAYQLHGALYQGAIPATFLATANTNKAASPNSPAGIPQAMYPTNPYMLGIVMPTAITQANQPGQSVPTTATSPSATAAAAAAASVASYSYNNQNAAIAAAFESFVPIAPAASPRFSQTLAHLASAYTPFLPRGAVPGNAPVQFAAQRMVPMSTMHSQTSGNGQMAPTVLNLGDYAVKYPLNTVKPGSYNPQPSTASNAAQANTHPQTAVVAAMPYVAFGQINHPRFPFSVNFAAPSVSTNPSVTSSSPSPSCSFVTSATTPHQYGAVTNTDCHTGGAVLGYVTMPFTTNPAGTGHPSPAPNPHPGSAFSPPSSHSSASHSSQRMDVSGPAQHLPSWCANKSLPGATNKRRCSTPENSSSGCCSVTNSCASFSVPSRSSCMEVSASSATALRTSSTSCSQSPRHPSVTSPLNSPLPMPMPNQGLSACRASPKGDSLLTSSKSSVEGIPSRIQSFNAVESHQVKTSSEMSSTLKRTYSDSNEQTKKTKYNESAYYEANPLLGLKRSCEAIEAYCSPERVDGDDEDDIDDRLASKNDESSPENNQSGEGNLSSKKFSNLNSCSANNDRSRGMRNSRGEQSVPVENEPISSKRQSHSVYNGDVSPNQNEAARVQMVNQDSYLPVKTNSISSNTADNQACMYQPPVPITRPQFDIGDIVWAQARGLPSWPGKVVDASEVGKGTPDDGKRWVMWFGDHTFSQVEVDRLKTLSDGLRTLDDKARKKKYKAKKARIGLEQAISEALEALEMRERLRGRQAARSKAKKKRIR